MTKIAQYKSFEYFSPVDFRKEKFRKDVQFSSDDSIYDPPQKTLISTYDWKRKSNDTSKDTIETKT
jgi:hypothetical protein